MPTTQDPLDAFRTLPADIQQWLDSPLALSKMIALNNRLNLKGHRRSTLPDLVFRLVTRDLDPQDFVSTLALTLKVGDNAARAITKELEKEILHPIEDSLRVNVGIETQLLHFEGDTTIAPVPKFEDVMPKDSEKWKVESGKLQAGNAGNGIESGSKIAASGVHHDVIAPGVWKHIDAPIDSKIVVPAGPVILHTEKEETAPITQAPRPIFSLKIPTNKKQYVSAPAPLAARVEVPENSGKWKVESPGAVESGRLKVESGNGEGKKEERQPPMRALSEMHISEKLKVESKKEDEITSSAIKSVAPKSTSSRIGEQKISTPAPLRPKIIPVVAKIPLRRVVHYSDWRTLI